MPETSENPIVHFKKKFLEASILVLTALVLAFIIGVMGETIGLFLPGLDPESRRLLLTGSVAISIGLGLLGFHLLVPPFTVKKNAICRLLLNSRTGEFLPSVYYSFYRAQSFLQQAARVLRDREPRLVEEIKQGLPKRPSEKNIYNQCVEYLVYAWLKSETIRSISHRIPHKTLELKEFPERLRENVFLKAFSTLEPMDIVEKALSQVWLEVPEDMRTNYHDAGIAFKGRYCDISVSYGIRALWPIQSMHVSPGPRLIPVLPVTIRTAPWLSNSTFLNLSESSSPIRHPLS
jgi:hypothetical protein